MSTSVLKDKLKYTDIQPPCFCTAQNILQISKISAWDLPDESTVQVQQEIQKIHDRQLFMKKKYITT